MYLVFIHTNALDTSVTDAPRLLTEDPVEAVKSARSAWKDERLEPFISIVAIYSLDIGKESSPFDFRYFADDSHAPNTPFVARRNMREGGWFELIDSDFAQFVPPAEH